LERFTLAEAGAAKGEQAAKEQLAQQKKMAALLDKIETGLSRLGVV